MVLTSCGHRLVVRMTGLIAATSPLPESTAFHNGVIRPSAAAQQGLASGRRNRLPGGLPRCPGSSCECPGYRQSSSGLRPAHFARAQGRRYETRRLPKWDIKSSDQSDCRARPGIMTAQRAFFGQRFYSTPERSRSEARMSCIYGCKAFPGRIRAVPQVGA